MADINDEKKRAAEKQRARGAEPSGGAPSERPDACLGGAGLPGTGIYLADQIFYRLISGKRATVFELRAVLSAAVDGDTLKRAAAEAMNVHRNFLSRPVVTDGRVTPE